MIIKSPAPDWHIVSVFNQAGKRLTFFGQRLDILRERALGASSGAYQQNSGVVRGKGDVKNS